MSDDLTINEMVKSPPTDLLAWSVMHLVSLHKGDFLKHYGIDASNHDNTVKVELRVNGVEVSPREVFAELERQHDAMVKVAAMELVKEKFAGLDDIATLVSELRSFAERKASSALGVEWRDSW